MANHLVVFPGPSRETDRHAEALAYQTWANDPARNPFSDGDFAYLRQDVAGDWVVPYLGPPFQYPVGTPFPEPEGGEAMRATGEIRSAVQWPEDPEE